MNIANYVAANLLETSDTLNQDEVQEAIDALAEAADNPKHADRPQYEALVAFQAECEQYCDDWQYGDSAISEDYFVEYIKQLIQDCYEMPKAFDSGQWPYRHMAIDFEAAAEEARQDYTAITLLGKTFYVR